jgi:hypothetical protein
MRCKLMQKDMPTVTGAIVLQFVLGNSPNETQDYAFIWSLWRPT